MKSDQNRMVIAITQGDINGIGYEVIYKALSDNRLYDNATIVIYGSPKVAAYHRKAANLVNLNMNIIRFVDELIPKRINIINVIDESVRVELGKSTQTAGEGSIAALNRAVEDLKADKVDILLTAPINKKNIQEAGFDFPGHTEFLAKSFDSEDYIMLMVTNKVKIGVVTGHIPLVEVSKNITIDNILNKLRIINKSMKEDFCIRKPVLAVLGLNPHAGDNGVLGREEIEIILPAIQKANEEGIMAFGPYAADGFFGSDDYTKFDAILAMYHDQGLIPFKTLSFDEGVNFTAGLPIVRTSPAHGTAYDIAGKGVASEGSFRSALYMAIDIWKNRKLLEGIEPLQKQAVLETEM